MVLLLSLQFGAAVRFMWKDVLTRKFRCDAIHLAYALFKERILLPWGTRNFDGKIQPVVCVRFYSKHIETAVYTYSGTHSVRIGTTCLAAKKRAVHLIAVRIGASRYFVNLLIFNGSCILLTLSLNFIEWRSKRNPVRSIHSVSYLIAVTNCVHTNF